MTKRKRTPAQKLARRIQAETGEPYMACLAEAKKRIAAETDNVRRSQR